MALVSRSHPRRCAKAGLPGALREAGLELEDLGDILAGRAGGRRRRANRGRKGDPGDWGDINHAAFAVGRDYLLTADRNFLEALVKVRAQPRVTMAATLFVNRTAPDIYIEIKSVLGW